MGRDAKIGLLVGLSFILLFAVILAKRNGEWEANPREAPSEVAAAVDQGKVPPVTPPAEVPPGPLVDRRPTSPGAVLSPDHPGETPKSPPADLTGPVVVTRGPHVQPTALPPVVVGSPAEAEPRPAGPRAGSSLPEGSSAGSTAVASLDATGRSPSPRLQIPTGTGATPAPASDRPAGASSAAEPSPSPVGASPLDRRETTAAPEKTYEVKPGDSLFSIARRELGKGTRWKLLLEANKDKLSSERDLRPGMKLRIPGPPATSATSGADTPTAATVASPPTGVLPGTVRSGAAPNTAVQVQAQRSPLARTEVAASTGSEGTYTVKAGDSLRKIASRVLKDESKWRLLYELNKDRLSSPDEVREGVVLKVPAEPTRPSDVASGPRSTY